MKLVIRKNDRTETHVWTVDAPPSAFKRLALDLNRFFASTGQTLVARVEED